ncbi:vitamin K-dependent gamma-carboxylase-like [Mizuhopecten yessoensis]|uniref:Vitamin K-dependent gamma-carboxylase n=1 Tax=Mizuhopecten yessoensis TaxID=6573 RepID=A0A210QCE1_MIZYE|nr:vitamin K-dependent gamma-carboxylase-like [Mizuhopecten yessoensis]OWF46370.1 Vitamin K-dependent gamma-carboxylase [Mizuhopecten yessoensis]
MASVTRRKTTENQIRSDGSRKSNGTVTDVSVDTKESHQRQIFGFAFRDLTSWNSIVRLLCRPTDPAALGILRFLYGLLLMIDTLEERGMGHQAYRRWAPDKCFSPLFDFLTPLSVAWMYLLYFVMLLATVGIMFGFLYRWCLFIFTAIYWYMILLDSSVWNNHSYLFGLLAFLLLVTDGNRYWSVDSLIWPKLRNQEVPLWNYTVMRFQVFILYFCAGIKKIDPEWLYGWSQRLASGHWVFDIFRPFLTNSHIDLFIIHWIGFLLDLTLGFLLFFDKTRVFGLIVGLSFHAMNSQIYSIGMFPFIGMATLTVFCYPDWPRKIINKIATWRSPTSFLSSPHCLYTKDAAKSESESERNYDGKKNRKQTTPTYRHDDTTKNRPTQAGPYHIISVFFVFIYIAEQLFLPFSFGVFKGLDNGVGGLYGYSWNMMIYYPDPYIKIYIRDLETGEETDVSKLVTNKSESSRWAYNPSMLLQFTKCLARKVDDDGSLAGTFAITYDIWVKVNSRVRRRLYDPNKDMLTAEWNLFSKTDWVFPPLPDYWEMRKKKFEMIEEFNETAFRFQSDLPGYTDEIEINNKSNFTIGILKGKVIIEDPVLSHNVTLEDGESYLLPPREQFLVHTVSDVPSYISISRPLDMKFSRYLKAVEAKENGEDPDGERMKEFKGDKDIYSFDQRIAEDKAQKANPIGPQWSLDGFIAFVKERFFLFKQGMFYAYAAIRSILGGKSFEEYAKASKTYFNKV